MLNLILVLAQSLKKWDYLFWKKRRFTTTLTCFKCNKQFSEVDAGFQSMRKIRLIKLWLIYSKEDQIYPKVSLTKSSLMKLRQSLSPLLISKQIFSRVTFKPLYQLMVLLNIEKSTLVYQPLLVFRSNLVWCLVIWVMVEWSLRFPYGCVCIKSQSQNQKVCLRCFSILDICSC